MKKDYCITGCGAEIHAKEYCRMHYERLRRDGELGPITNYTPGPKIDAHPEWAIHRIREIIARDGTLTDAEIAREAKVTRSRVAQLKEKYEL